MSTKFNFVIARFWDEDEYATEKDRLCVYMVHNKEVHYGTEEEAFKMAKTISDMKNKEYYPCFIPVYIDEKQ